MKRSKLIGFLLGATVLLSVPCAVACFTMPRNLARPHSDVVGEAKCIFWAEAIAGVPSNRTARARTPVDYKLRVVRVLKGEARTSLELEGEGDLSDIWDTTFSNHTDEEFWKQSSGRMGIDEDCLLVPPCFVMGRRYLVFISENEDTKHFERVDDEGDRWLQYVAKQTTQHHRSSAPPKKH